MMKKWKQYIFSSLEPICKGRNSSVSFEEDDSPAARVRCIEARRVPPIRKRGGVHRSSQVQFFWNRSNSKKLWQIQKGSGIIAFSGMDFSITVRYQSQWTKMLSMVLFLGCILASWGLHVVAYIKHSDNSRARNKAWGRNPDPSWNRRYRECDRISRICRAFNREHFGSWAAYRTALETRIVVEITRNEENFKHFIPLPGEHGGQNQAMPLKSIMCLNECRKQKKDSREQIVGGSSQEMLHWQAKNCTNGTSEIPHIIERADGSKCKPDTRSEHDIGRRWREPPLPT